MEDILRKENELKAERVKLEEYYQKYEAAQAKLQQEQKQLDRTQGQNTELQRLKH